MNKAKLQYAASMAIAGTIGPFIRLLPLLPGQIVLARSVLGCLLAAALFFLRGGGGLPRPHRKDGKVLLASGLALGVNWILLFQAFAHTTVSVAVICYNFAPVVVLLLSPLLFRERLGGRKLLCAAVAVAGMVCVSGGPGQGGTGDKGVAFGLAASILYAAVMVLNRYITSTPPLERCIVQLGVSATPVLCYVLAAEGLHYSHLTPRQALVLATVGFVHTGLLYLLFFTSLPCLTAQSVALLSYLDPLIAVFASAVVLREGLTVLQAVGGAMILGACGAAELAAAKTAKEKRDCNEY